MITKLYSKINDNITYCYNIHHDYILENRDLYLLLHLLKNDSKNFIIDTHDSYFEAEIGPKSAFKTTWSANVVEILNKINIYNITSIEKSILYKNKPLIFDTLTLEDYKKPSIKNERIQSKFISIYNLKDLGESKFNYYFSNLKRNFITNVEEFDLRQSNSEHSRHWFFNGNYIINSVTDDISLLKKIKFTNHLINNNSLIAFSDNSSSIFGYSCYSLFNQLNHEVIYKLQYVCPTHTAETHNFPTSISPFSGANTGVGGRIRDTIAIGKGGNIISGYCGYCVGDIDNRSHDYPYCHPKDLLIEASNGASDYGNKIGEPIISGFTRSFKTYIDNQNYEFVKPIMYCGSIGSITKSNLYKQPAEPGMIVCQIGGPAYKIGLGGSCASSVSQDENNKNNDYNAVQRGDPYMANKLCRFIKRCADLESLNPILNLHDQGSGGMGNVVKELVHPYGAYINLNNVDLGDKDMTSYEIWCSEYQEQCAFLTTPKHISILKLFAKEENVNIRFIGVVNYGENVDVFNKNDVINNPINLPNNLVNPPSQLYKLKEHPELKLINKYIDDNIFKNLNFNDVLNSVLSDLDVGCKKFLTNKVDRSVSGLIAQQQCIGPYQLPLSDYSITKLNFNDYRGVACSIGERPYIGLIDVEHMVNMSLGEMLTNLINVGIDKFNNIKLLGNWMWSTNIKDDNYLLYKAVNKLVKTLKKLEIGIDGGKDSLSMNTKYKDKIIKSPNSLVLSSYVLVPDLRLKLTPDFKCKNSAILYLPLSKYKRIGGSILLKKLNKIDEEYYTPNFENIIEFKKIFEIIQYCIKNRYLNAGHDISDGGLIVSLIEMCISSNLGCSIDIESDDNMYRYLFNEELGLVYEVNMNYYNEILKLLENTNYKIIGKTNTSNKFVLNYNKTQVINEKKLVLLKKWQEKSFELELLQCNKKCVFSEYNEINLNVPKFKWDKNLYFGDTYNDICILILREDGSNGDNELCACFVNCGFKVYNMNINQLIRNMSILNKINGIAFCGGFTFSDVLGSATGWSYIINENELLKSKFDEFYNRNDTFSIGICNGCQLMSKIGWIPKCKLLENVSERFESRYLTIKVNKSNCIFTKGMEDITFGMWSAHKEGQFDISDNKVFSYCDNNGKETMKYPENPNGSPNSCAGICSDNGRHLAIMPHPERSFYTWQMPWVPKSYDNIYTPWKQLFINAYLWIKKIKNI